MTDHETWQLAIAAVEAEYEGLAFSRKALIVELAGAVKACKEALHADVEAAGADGICASCGGECCMTGKFHFTVVDFLAYLAEGRELFVPRFAGDRCPYLGERGCLMAPPYRPFNCVTFNCDRVEWLLEPLEKERSVRLERELRGLYGRFEKEFGNRFMGGLLMNFERDIVREGAQILKTVNGEQ